MVKLVKEYRCLLCFLKDLTIIGFITRYMGGILHLGHFSYPHVVSERHHKLTRKIYVIEREPKRYICPHCWNVFKHENLKEMDYEKWLKGELKWQK